MPEICQNRQSSARFLNLDTDIDQKGGKKRIEMFNRPKPNQRWENEKQIAELMIWQTKQTTEGGGAGVNRSVRV